MHIATLIFPGAWLSGDAGECAKITGLLDMLALELADAALSLGMFEQSLERPNDLHQERRRAGNERLRELEDGIASSRAVGWQDQEARDKIRVEAKLELLKEFAAAGVMPRSYSDRLPFIHAKSFLFAMDTIRKVLLTLKRYPISMPAADKALAVLLAALPDLAGVRDSTAHADERAVGEARKKPIVTQPINNGQISAPQGGVLMIGSLMGSNFSCTLDTGILGRVEVSVNSLHAAQRAVQLLIDDLPWRDPKFPRAYPSV